MVRLEVIGHGFTSTAQSHPIATSALATEKLFIPHGVESRSLGDETREDGSLALAHFVNTATAHAIRARLASLPPSKREPYHETPRQHQTSRQRIPSQWRQLQQCFLHVALKRDFNDVRRLVRIETVSGNERSPSLRRTYLALPGRVNLGRVRARRPQAVEDFDVTSAYR